MTRTMFLSGAAIVAAAGSFVLAGDLNPPPGAPAPTPGPEPRIAINATNTPGDADSMFKITQPGSYYLTGNIQGVADKHGIEIVASGVTVDLNGFELLGAGGVGFFDGVSATIFPLTNIAVVNGSVRDWGDEGVDLASNSPVNCRVEGVLASENNEHGIFVGVGSTVTNCSASDNGDTGIRATAGCTVSNCAAFRNTDVGILATGGSTISNCAVYLNLGIGISIISSPSGSTVADCTVRLNTFSGIVCSDSCAIRDNNCSNNGNGGDGAGINATGTDNRIEGNNCTGADRGIDVDGAGNIIVGNTCSGNTTNFSIAVGNSLGPILAAGTNAVAINGATAAGTLTSSDPWANFSY